jgi:uncharacterized protein (DUF924 family)
MTTTTAQNVLDYWITTLGPAAWYAGGEDLDADIRTRFADAWRAAAAGGLTGWAETAPGALAYIILTDQFPRNMWRGHADAFATDAMALSAARAAIAAGHDMGTPEPQRQFFYLPFMHSEDPADQAACVGYMATRMPETGASNHLHARAHAQIIDRFGRFPYRNAALGRTTTTDEADFMAQGGYGAIVQALQGPA